MPENRLTGIWRGLAPLEGGSVEDLHQVDVANVVPPADQVHVAIPVDSCHRVIHRHRHIGDLRTKAAARIEAVDLRRGNLGAVLGNRVAAENPHCFPNRDSHCRQKPERRFPRDRSEN